MPLGLEFRNDGAWGSGKGSPLTSLQVDNNFYILYQQIIAKAQQGVGIADVTPSGNQLYFTLTDHTVIGPVPIPILQPNFRGSWQPLTAYFAYDVVSVVSDDEASLYGVLINHTSQSSFDPNANDGMGHNFYQLWFTIPLTPPPAVQTQTGSTFTPALTDAQTYNRCTNGGGCTITIPANSSVAFPIGTEIRFRQANATSMIFVAASPAVINPVTGFLDQTILEGANVTIKKVDTDSWDIYGLLEPLSGA